MTTTESTRTSDWLAAQIGADGAVNVAGETSSTTTQTMYVAEGLAASGQHRDALARAMGYLALHVNDWVVNDSTYTLAPIGSDLPGRLSYLILLVHTVGGDPASFGSPATNLVARLQALYGVSSPGFYGVQEPYSAVFDQSLVVMALLSLGNTPPNAAVQWIVDQQCMGGSNPAGSLGGWQALRATVGSALVDCDTPDPMSYAGPDTNDTAIAMQALVAAGRTTEISSALTFLHAAQATSGVKAGGFPFITGGGPDSNSTALVIQAIVAAGQSPTGGAWSIGSSSPVSILTTWQVTTPGQDLGAFSYQAGMSPDLMSTYQALWGLTLTAFPFPVLPVVLPAESMPDAPAAVPTFTG
ncbi:MAG: hypothetical protein JHC63_09810 [Acidimicrobiia bacterium]|nr:hypothetical protein [Acidimicrobiia bacterium]